MMHVYLRFPDESTAVDALSEYRAEYGWVVVGRTHALDVIGSIFSEGDVDAEGAQLSPPVQVDGFHINLVVDSLPAAATTYVVHPTTPDRVFAGAI